MAQADESTTLDIGSRQVTVTHPDKPYYTRDVKLTKLDVVRYYLAVAEGALNGIRDRPIVLKRFVDGAESPPFYQKRAPSKHPEWLRTVVLSFPSGRTAEEVVVDDAAGLAWIVNLGCLELHPHPVRSADLHHPDELRVDLDPGPGVEFADVRRVALEVQALLQEVGLRGWPKTSGSRGMHINVRIHPEHPFAEVRRAALALSREIERRAPAIATSKWWKEERHGVFIDYNQNAKDRTTCSAYSLRPLPDARVSAPLDWTEVADCEPGDFTALTMPRRFAELGDPHRDIDQHPGSLAALLELAARDEASGLADAPWPPHYRKTEAEAPRVAPSRAKRPPAPRPQARRDAPADARSNTTLADARDSARPDTLADARPGDTLADARASARPDDTLADTLADTRSNTTPADTPSRAAPKRTRRTAAPLLTVANSPDKQAALAGLERFRSKFPEISEKLAVDDILIDSMRGRSTTWTRIRVNLRHVPEPLRPKDYTPDPNDDPTAAWRHARKP